MNPVDFPQSNNNFGPPEGCDASQVQVIRGYVGQVERGNMDGAYIVVTAWQPSADEIREIMEGNPVFLTCMGGLPPHFLSTCFEQAASIQ